MPVISIVAPTVPAEDREKFLAVWPSLNEELKAQPGVVGLLAGPIIAEDGELVEEGKFFQSLAFKTAEDLQTFENSAWAQERKKKFEEHHGTGPHIGKFEVSEPPADLTPEPLVQISTLELADGSKAEEAKKAWFDLVAALGKTATGGGRSIGEGAPHVGLGLLGWSSLEEAKAAYEKPEAAAALAAYKALGKTRSGLVRVEHASKA